MALSKKVFIAPDVFTAFIDRVHPKYEESLHYFNFFAEQEYQLFTDIQTLITVYNQIVKDISPSLAKDFLKTITMSNINLLYADGNDMKAAFKTLLAYQTTELTFNEAIMAVLATRRSIPQVCTFSYLRPLFGLTIFYLPV